MKAKEGDVLVCQCEDCGMEVTVSKSCSGDTCSTCEDLEVMCCGEPMEKKEKGCCCA
jgi:hypothetical protein